MVLDTELAVFARMKEELLQAHEGRFVLIHGEEFVGAFDTMACGYAEGVKRFGRGAFLLKRVPAEDRVYRN